MARKESVAYILYTRAFRNTSMIVELFSRDFGLVSVVAKGAKNPKSRFYSRLVVFDELQVAWQGRNELGTLVDAEQTGDKTSKVPVSFNLANNRLSSAYYMNELLLRFMTKEDAHPELYDCYKKSIHDLVSREEIEITLRLFEKELLAQSGYGLNLIYDTQSGEVVNEAELYHFEPHTGPSAIYTEPDGGFIVSGKMLHALENNRLDDKEILQQAKSLMRYAISSHLGGKPLQTRNFVLQKTL